MKIQGNSKYCKQHGDSNCEDCYIFGPISANKKFFNKLIFKKLRVSCHNLFLLGKRKPTRYTALQEDHDVSIYGLFYFGSVSSNMEISSKAPQKGKISSLFLPKFNRQYGISKMVSLSMRMLRELNLYGFFNFGPMGPNMEIRLQSPRKGKISILFLPKFY